MNLLSLNENSSFIDIKFLNLKKNDKLINFNLYLDKYILYFQFGYL